MKAVYFALFLLLACYAESIDDQFIYITEKPEVNYYNLVKAEGKHLVYIAAKWCQKGLEQFKSLRKEILPDVNMYIADIDYDQGNFYVKEEQLYAIPTVYYFLNGDKVARVEGYVPTTYDEVKQFPGIMNQN